MMAITLHGDKKPTQQVTASQVTDRAFLSEHWRNDKHSGF